MALTADAALVFEPLRIPGQWRVIGGREPYLIIADAGRGMACNCPGFRWRCSCRHLRELLRRQGPLDAAPDVTLHPAALREAIGETREGEIPPGEPPEDASDSIAPELRRLGFGGLRSAADPRLHDVLLRLSEESATLDPLDAGLLEVAAAEHLTRLGEVRADALVAAAVAHGRKAVADAARVRSNGGRAQETETPLAAPLALSRSLAEILVDPEADKPPTPVIPGLAWAGRLTLVAAREGVGKSTLFQAAAAAVTTGGAFLGEQCPQGTVLWILVEEHQSDLVIRALKFETAPSAFYVLERPAEPLLALRAEVGRLRPILLVVDTLHRFANSIVTDGHTADQWGPLMDTLDRIARESNAAILMSAQAVKATGDYRDSSAIGHGVDVVLNLVRPDKESPVRRLEKQKARWALDDVQFELVGDTYQRGGTPSKKLSPQRQAVLDALEPPMTYSEWREASQVPDTTFKRAIKFLGEHGHVRQTDDGAYTKNEGPLGPFKGHGPSGPEPELGPPRPRTVSASGGPSAEGGLLGP